MVTYEAPKPNCLGDHVVQHVNTYFCEDEDGFLMLREIDGYDTAFHAEASKIRISDMYAVDPAIIEEAVAYELKQRNLGASEDIIASFVVPDHL